MAAKVKANIIRADTGEVEREKVRAETDQEALDLALKWAADFDSRPPESGSWIRATSDSGMLIYYREW